MSAGLGPPEPILDRARALAAAFALTAGEHDRAASFPYANFDRLAEAGLLALRTPAEHGGLGASLGEAAAVVGAVARGEAATALVLAMHLIQQSTVARSARWPGHLKARLARESVEGVSLVNALRVEPDLGTPARGGLPATTAVRSGDRWLLTGHKIYSILRWYAVWAKTDEESPRVGTFLVPAGLPGIRIAETWDHLGLRASGSHDVHFTQAAIPLDHAVDIRPPAAWRPDDVLAQHVENGVLLAAMYHGIASAARSWLVGFLRERSPSNLGHPLAELPRVRAVVGAIDLTLRAGARLIAGLAAEIDAGGKPAATDAYVVKSTVTNDAVAAIETALSLTGNHGLSRRNPLERHYRDALCGRVHTPQDDAVRMILGTAALDR